MATGSSREGAACVFASRARNAPMKRCGRSAVTTAAVARTVGCVEPRSRARGVEPANGQGSGRARRSLIDSASTSETAVSAIKYHANAVSLPVLLMSHVATAGAEPPNSAYASP